MKKFLIGIVLIAVLAFGGLKITEKIVQGGDDYYVKITDKGNKNTDRTDDGEPIISYDYALTGVDKSGQKKKMHFTAYKNRPLIQRAYLKVTWNQKKGVTSYKQIKENDIPTKAKEKL